MTNTPNLNLPMPDPAADVDDEFYRLQQAWMLLDTILFQLMASVARKSDQGHTHAIEQINGLVTALQNKMDANKTFKLGDLLDVLGSIDAATGYVLSKNADGKFVFASAASLLGNHQHAIGDSVGLADALNARVQKSGDIMTGTPVLGFDYAQIRWGNAAVGTGWRIIKDTPEGQTGALVFQYSIDRWNNASTTMYIGPDGLVRFIKKIQALEGINVVGSIDASGNISAQGRLYVGTAGSFLETDGNIAFTGGQATLYGANLGSALSARVRKVEDKATAADITAGTVDKFPDAAAVKAGIAVNAPSVAPGVNLATGSLAANTPQQNAGSKIMVVNWFNSGPGGTPSATTLRLGSTTTLADVIAVPVGAAYALIVPPGAYWGHSQTGGTNTWSYRVQT